jgi:hypothetical protein
MEAHQLVNQSSGIVEYYTDPVIPFAAREVMGGIDLDPASCLLANAFGVFADHIFTKESDGLARAWSGRVWLNHPFHRGENPCPENRAKCKKNVCKTARGHIDTRIPSNKDWINKAVAEFESGNVSSLMLICFASTSEGWFRPLLDYPLCFLTPRTNYYRPDGTLAGDVSKGSVVAYLGTEPTRFKRIFEDKHKLGVVKY